MQSTDSKPQPAPASPPRQRARFIADILEEHVEEAQFLWMQREAALLSPAQSVRDVKELEQRIEAHVQGIEVAGEDALPVLDAAMSADAAGAFVAAHAMLRMNKEPLRRRVLDALAAAAPGLLGGFAQALCHGPLGAELKRVRELFSGGPAPVSAAAAEVLAVHSPRELMVQQLEPLLRNKDAAVRYSAWRAVRAGEVAVPAATFRQAVEDDDEAVRAVALSAAAWSRQVWLLDHLRAAAARPAPQKPEGLVMLGILATPVDVPLIQRIATNAALGPGRFDAVAAYGHPEVVPALLIAMRDKDVASAAAAGEAFTRITGVDVASGRRATVPPADGHEPDEFEKEFLEEVMLPDAQAATERWQKVKGAFTAGTRWSRGVNLSDSAGEADLATLDMQARWQARVRARYAGSWSGRYFEVEKFPMAG